ncbi:MAG TPA: glycosyltransferase family 87 protein, partial [Candidatus Binataceae bacterium]|nr:glycosyltransferase family 87 protein [Candidatus Binataceae bacterium]
LTLLTPVHAYIVWTLLSVGAFLGAMFLVLGSESHLSVGSRIVLLMMALAFPPVADNLRWSQSQFFVLLGLAAMMRLLVRRADGSAGGLLALLGLLRIYPLTMGGQLLAERNWRATVSLALTFLAGVTLTMLVGPGVSSAGFLRSFGMGGASGGSPFDVWIYRPASVSLLAFISRLLILAGYPHATSGWPKVLITVVVALVVLWVSAVTTWHHRDRPARNFCLWVVTTLILSPMVWLHYLVLLLIPYGSIAIARFRGETGPITSTAALLSYCWIMITTPLLAELSFVYQEKSPYHLAISEVGFIGIAFAYVVVLAFAAESQDSLAEDSSSVIRGAMGRPQSAI